MRVVLLPGLDGTGLLFSPLLKQLTDDVACEVISYPVNKKMNYAELESYVRSKLPTDESYILVAESFSGVIGYQIAADPPKGLKKIIFAACFLRPPLPYLNVISCLPLSLLIKLPIPRFVETRYLFGKHGNQQLTSLFKEALNKSSEKVLAHRMRELINLNIGLKQITIPGIYIQATEDHLVPMENIENFKNNILTLSVESVDGPHFVLQTKPNECATIIKKQLTHLNLK